MIQLLFPSSSSLKLVTSKQCKNERHIGTSEFLQKLCEWDVNNYEPLSPYMILQPGTSSPRSKKPCVVYFHLTAQARRAVDSGRLPAWCLLEDWPPAANGQGEVHPLAKMDVFLTSWTRYFFSQVPSLHTKALSVDVFREVKIMLVRCIQ